MVGGRGKYAHPNTELIVTNARPGRGARALLLTACLTLFLSSCGDSDDDPDASTTVAESSAPDESPSVDATADTTSLDLEDAAAAALKAVNRSSLLTIETEPNRTVWEVTVVKKKNGTEREMLISLDDGELIDGPTKKFDDAEDKAENRRLVASAKVGYRKAAKSIREAVPDARLTELKLDTFEDWITAWEGSLYGDNGVRWSVTINARNGDVLEKDADADDDD
jgi:uncharacterized membrane protein YkoI